MANNAPNNHESNNKATKHEDLSQLIASSQKDFITSKIAKNMNYFDQNGIHFDDYISFLNINSKKYASISNDFVNYTDAQKKNIERQVITQVVKKTASIKQSLKTAEEIFVDSYDFSVDQSKSIVLWLAKSSQEEIAKILDTQKARIDFLKRNKIIKSPDDLVEKNQEDFFSDFKITKKDIQKAQANGIDLAAVQNYFVDIHNPDFDKIIKDFFTFCNENQKKQFLKTFLRDIPVNILEDIWLLDESQVRKIIQNSIPQNINISQSEIDDIIDSIDKTTFYLPLDLDKINTDDFEKLIASEDFLKYFDSKFKKNKESYTHRADITNKLDETPKDKYPDVLKSFIQENNNIHPDIKKSFKVAQEWMFIKTWNESTQMHNFVKITNLNTGTIAESAGVEIKETSHLWKIRPNKPGATKRVSYIQFIDYLEILSNKITQNNNSALENHDFFQIISQKNLEENDDIESVEELENISSKQECKDYLNELDWENKDVDIDKTSFIIWNSETKWTSFDVTFDDTKTLPVILDTGDKFSYEDFIDRFKQYECKRFETIQSPEDLLNKLQNWNHEISSKFEWLKIKNGKIIGWSEKNEIEYNYFISESASSNQSIYCDDVSRWEYITGEYKKRTEKERKKWEKETLEVNKNGKYIGLSDMYQQIIQNGLIPHSVKDYEVPDQENVWDFNQKSSFTKRLFSGSSMAELMWAFKIWFDAVSQKLETGSKLKSAKLAMKIASVTWKEWDLYTSMQQIVEAENKKQMEEIIGQLKNTDSDVMLKKIIKIIENKDSEEYEKEAALMTIVWKYGTLYPKDYSDLCDRRNEWVWYRAFGWKVDDELFKRIKADCEWSGDKNNPPTPFTEEVLMERLLKEQKKAPYNRRSKLHKDYGWALNWGIKDEQEDGANKTSDMATLEWKIDYIIWNMAGWEVVNSSWALDNLINHNGDHIKTAKVPFVFTITNMAKDMNQWVLKKSFVNRGFATPYTTFLFNMTPGSRDLFYSTTELIIKSFNNKAMEASFEKIKKNSGNTGVEVAAKFWDDYGGKLLPMMQCQDWFVLSKVKDKINEDDPDYENKIKEQETYKEYYKYLVWMTNDTEYSIEKDMINDGRFDSEKLNTAFVGMERMCETQFKVSTDGKIDTLSQRLFSQSLKTLEWVLQNPNLSREEKKENYLRLFTPLWATAHEAYDNRSKCGFLNTLKFYGFNVVNNPNFDKNSPAVTNDPKYNKPEADEFKRLKAQYLETSAYEKFCKKSTNEFFDEHVDNNGFIKSKDIVDENDIFATMDEIQWKVSENLNKDSKENNSQQQNNQNQTN